MRFLVIGGAGYIGSHFVREAKRQGHVSVVYDNLSRGFRDSIDEDVELIEADLLDKKRLDALLRSSPFDAVFHFAAYALVGESVAQPDLYYANNVEGVRTLLEVLRGLEGAPVLVFSSTCAVFGTPLRLPIAEDDPKKPLSPYGKSKLVNEWMIEDYSLAYGLRAMALRYFNACGADQDGDIGEAHEPETHLIPNVIRAALKGELLAIFGEDFDTPDGTCIRDYVHVTDLADAHIKAAIYLSEKRGPFYDAIHLGTGTGYSNLEVLRATEQVLGQSIAYKIGPRRPGDPAGLYADSRKARATLGFDPKSSSLDMILRSALAWHQAFPRGFARQSMDSPE